MDNNNSLSLPTVHLGYLSDEAIISFIQRTKTHLRFLGPGVSKAVAEALVAIWRQKGPESVEVVLDADSNVCRLGYSEDAAIELIMRTAVDFNVSVYRQSGLRLCVLDVDGDRIVFPPAPRLVEEATERGSEILLSPSPDSDLEDQILSSRNARLHTLTTEDVAEVVENLRLCPPQPFDLARKILVLSTRIQFVEFGLQNAALTRKRARVPTDLLGLAQAADISTRDLLRASFQLISKDDEISGDHLLKQRGLIERRYTSSLGRYGRVIRHDCRAEFESAVMELRAQVERFKDEARQKLQETIARNCEAVVVRLLPVVSARIPDRWIASLGTRPSEAQVRARLAAEIEEAFGEPNVYLQEISVSLIFKDITASMLQDSEFSVAAADAGLDLATLFEEYEAARIRD